LLDAPVAIAFMALVENVYSSMTQTPLGVSVIPLDNTAAFAPKARDIVLADVLIKTRPFLFALEATACADVTPTVAKVGEEPVSADFVLTITTPDIPVLVPTP